MEILQGTRIMDGVIWTFQMLAVLIRQLKENAWILIIAGGSIMIGIMSLQAEIATTRELVVGEKIIQYLMSGILDVIFLI